MITVMDVEKEVRVSFEGKEVYFSLNELPEYLEIPEEWKGFGIFDMASPNFPEAWNFFSEELPWVLSLLEAGLIGTAILNGDRIELIYIFHDSKGLYYYLGGTPLSHDAAKKSNCNKFVGKVADFYNKLHDGFTYFPAESMGFRKADDLCSIADFIDEEDTVFAEDWLALFSNGGGDYVALDLNFPSENKGVIWWHDQPLKPELDIDVFKIVDTWISIFLEDTMPRENVLVRQIDLAPE